MRLLIFLVFSLLSAAGWWQEKYFIALYDSCVADTEKSFDLIHSVELISFGTETGFTDGVHGKPAWPRIDQTDACALFAAVVGQKYEIHGDKQNVAHQDQSAQGDSRFWLETGKFLRVMTCMSYEFVNIVKRIVIKIKENNETEPGIMAV